LPCSSSTTSVELVRTAGGVDLVGSQLEAVADGGAVFRGRTGQRGGDADLDVGGVGAEGGGCGERDQSGLEGNGVSHEEAVVGKV
jgi:hypothetical protein